MWMIRHILEEWVFLLRIKLKAMNWNFISRSGANPEFFSVSEGGGRTFSWNQNSFSCKSICIVMFYLCKFQGEGSIDPRMWIILKQRDIFFYLIARSINYWRIFTPLKIICLSFRDTYYVGFVKLFYTFGLFLFISKCVGKDNFKVNNSKHSIYNWVCW